MCVLKLNVEPLVTVKAPFVAVIAVTALPSPVVVAVVIVSVALNTPVDESIDKLLPTLIPPKAEEEAIGRLYSEILTQEATVPSVDKNLPLLLV